MMQSNFGKLRSALAAGLGAVVALGVLAEAAWSQTAAPISSAAPGAAANAVEVLRQRAEAGDAQAQMTMGYRYDTGTGVAKDAVEALVWYRKAAEQGDVTSQSNLGLAYHYGRGVPIDLNEAKRWYLKAADQKFAQAQHNLGLILANSAVQQDRDEAMTWFVSAAELGYEPAKAEIAKYEIAIVGKKIGGPAVVVAPVETALAPKPVVAVPVVVLPTLTPPVAPQPRVETPIAAAPVVQPRPAPVQPSVQPKPVIIAKVDPVDPSLRPSARGSAGEYPAREVPEPLKWYPGAKGLGAGAPRTVPAPRVTVGDSSDAGRDKVRDAGDVPPARNFYSKPSPQPLRYDGEEDQRKAFEAYLNSSQDIERDEDGRPLRMKQFLPQAILDGIHPGGTARSIKVHDLVVKWKKDRPTESAEDIIEYTARLTIFWRSPMNPDGFTKLNIIYDAEIERYTRGELLVTNGALKRTPVFQVGQGSAVPLVVPE